MDYGSADVNNISRNRLAVGICPVTASGQMLKLADI